MGVSFRSAFTAWSYRSRENEWPMAHEASANGRLIRGAERAECPLWVNDDGFCYQSGPTFGNGRRRANRREAPISSLARRSKQEQFATHLTTVVSDAVRWGHGFSKAQPSGLSFQGDRQFDTSANGQVSGGRGEAGFATQHFLQVRSRGNYDLDLRHSAADLASRPAAITSCSANCRQELLYLRLEPIAFHGERPGCREYLR